MTTFHTEGGGCLPGNETHCGMHGEEHLGTVKLRCTDMGCTDMRCFKVIVGIFEIYYGIFKGRTVGRKIEVSRCLREEQEWEQRGEIE